MTNQFFEKPILNSPHQYPKRHWELDTTGQPTRQLIQTRRRAEFITPIPKKQKGAAKQESMLFDIGLPSHKQAYGHTAVRDAIGAAHTPGMETRWQLRLQRTLKDRPWH